MRLLFPHGDTRSKVLGGKEVQDGPRRNTDYDLQAAGIQVDSNTVVSRGLATSSEPCFQVLQTKPAWVLVSRTVVQTTLTLSAMLQDLLSGLSGASNLQRLYQSVRRL